MPATTDRAPLMTQPPARLATSATGGRGSAAAPRDLRPNAKSVRSISKICTTSRTPQSLRTGRRSCLLSSQPATYTRTPSCSTTDRPDLSEQSQPPDTGEHNADPDEQPLARPPPQPVRHQRHLARRPPRWPMRRARPWTAPRCESADSLVGQGSGVSASTTRVPASWFPGRADRRPASSPWLSRISAVSTSCSRT